MVRFAKIALIAALLALPVLLHAALLLHWPVYWSASLIAAELTLMFTVMLGRSKSPWKGPLIVGAAGLSLFAAWHFGARGLQLSAGIPHAAAHGALLVLFTSSLRTGQEPILTGIMRHIRGPLSRELEVYGRQITIVWSLFFTAHLTLSACLLTFASLESWSFFINVINLPSIGAMFAAELLYRTVRFRHLPRSRISDMAKVVAAWRLRDTLPAPAPVVDP